MGRVSRDSWSASDPATRIVSEADVLEQLKLICFPRQTARDPSSTDADARTALDRLLRLGLPSSGARARLFDPYEVLHFLVWSHLRLGDPLWAETCVADQRAFTAEYADGGDRVFDLELERSLSSFGRRPGSGFRVQLPVVVATSPQRDVAVAARGDDLRIDVRSDGVDVRGTVPPSGTALGMQLQLTARTGWQGAVVEPERVEPFRDAEPEDAPYLAPAEGVMQVTEPIRALARELAADANTPWDALRRFWRFLFANMMPGNVYYHLLGDRDPLSDLMRIGWTDCWLGSSLLGALCRARGIPARIVSGCILYSAISATHYWLEVLVRPYGWLPCDLVLSWALARGDARDPEWSEFFLGRVDPRLVFERFPRPHFAFAPFLPRRFFLQQRMRAGWTEVAFRDLGDGALAYTDRLRAKIATVA
jgi:hypothetical protein